QPVVPFGTAGGSPEAFVVAVGLRIEPLPALGSRHRIARPKSSFNVGGQEGVLLATSNALQGLSSQACPAGVLPSEKQGAADPIPEDNGPDIQTFALQRRIGPRSFFGKLLLA